MPRSKRIQPTVIVKRRYEDEGEEHNSAWKLAYADFVTAMMTFFLIMWLMNVTTVEQRKGIADYFNPVALSQANSGADGMLAGRSVDKTGALSTPNAPGEHSVPVAAPPVVASLGDSDRQPAGRKDPMPNPPGGKAAPDRNARAELEAMLDRQAAALTEQQALDEAERDLRRRIATTPDLGALADGVLIQQTPQGLRVQLTDQVKASMFNVGSAQMNDQGRRLMRLVATAVAAAPNRLSISGHTDALGYADGAKYGNWELSSDRANAARRELIAAGIPAARIVRVEGRADLDHLDAANPLAPRNRRISITLLRGGE
ncbi:flagellar motor protein MotB [Azospirillum rugosum]|uniref:Chemotaxis protein MotB n=1 Tax=Azospirillum rugosum TaxID=416170 RepID=A0ABS4SU03_9PROT|nr:flagellar motor protein MotB [Azospirillum rugosum]MBP2296023.1 chemotaxis protein MotB [Azospirillum rugosum]MDQ0529613.1 chemotaxis protein MotB [Azospirillum rugosum]